MQKYVIVENGKQLENVTALNSWRRELTLHCLEVWKQRKHIFLTTVFLSSMMHSLCTYKAAIQVERYVALCLYEGQGCENK